MLKKTFTSGESGSPRPKATPADLKYDVARGILTFANADTPIAADPVPAADETDEQPQEA